MFTDWEQTEFVELQPNAEILDAHHDGLVADRFEAHALFAEDQRAGST
jgi:hypothetical protein